MISVRMMKYTEENNKDGRRVVTGKKKRQSGGWDVLVKSLNKFSDDFMSTGRSQEQKKEKAIARPILIKDKLGCLWQRL